MDRQLVPLKLDLQAQRLGRPQQAGPLTVLPLFGPDANGKFTPPLSGIKLAGVRGYGNVELHNPGRSGVAILPLHIGYIQDQAQNHALCGSAFLGVGQKRLFEDACCVQQAQGGYLESKEQWFFILPLHLREEALRLRGQKSYGKLWPAISTLNQRLGLEARGHLEQVICRQRPGTAKGVIFLTLEDETGTANIIVWARTFERFRRAVIAGRCLKVTGRLQRDGEVTHVVAEKIEDISPLLDEIVGLSALPEPPDP